MPEDAYIGYACKRVSVKNNDLVAILSLYNNMDESILAIVEPFWSSINFHPFPPLFMGGPSG